MRIGNPQRNRESLLKSKRRKRRRKKIRFRERNDVPDSDNDENSIFQEKGATSTSV